MFETNNGTRGQPASSPFMRAAFLLPLLLLSACDGGGNQQSGVSTNIVDQQEGVPDAATLDNADMNEILPEEMPSEQPASITSTFPAALQGRWTGINDACGDRTAELELNITPDTLIFHESVGTVSRVSREGESFRVNASFTGEGQSWTKPLELRPSANGRELTIINDGTALTRKRC